MINSEDLLAQLSNAKGAVGFEYPVRDILKSYFQQFPIDVETDNMGNLIGRFKKFDANNPTVLIMAHMDEIGFLTTEITQDGYIKVIPLGCWLNQVLWSQRWIIYHHDLSISAISGVDAPHMLSDDDRQDKTQLTYQKLFLDTGLSKTQLEDMGVRPGLPVVPDVQFSVQANKQRYIGKAFDDRAALAVMVRLMEKIAHEQTILDHVNVTFAATVQEEVGLRGAKVVSESIKPDVVINLEFAPARDYPCQYATENKPVLGEGPTLFVYDRGMIPNTPLLELMHQTALKHKIPTQWGYEEHYAQDAASLQASGKGLAAINVGIPVRYGHSHYGVMDKNDYDHTVSLLYHSINQITKKLKALIKQSSW
jgi:putative aminopeptidase FrvX